MNRGRLSYTLLFGALVLFIVGDLTYSFLQHLNVSLDGDMPNVIVPSPGYGEVFRDPFGISVITEGKSYTGTNRFFAHWSESKFYKTVPQLLQFFVTPIDSVYLAGAVFRSTLQILLTWLLATYIAGTGDIRRLKFVAAAALVLPLFQVEGFRETLSIILKSTTYAFFYTVPVTLLLLFFLPFYLGWLNKKPFTLTLFQKIMLLLLAVVIPFDGPLAPPLVLLVGPFVLLYFFWKGFRAATELRVMERLIIALKSIPVAVLFYFTFISLVSLYSYYVGLFNDENYTEVGLWERYALLGRGIYKQLFDEPAYPMLLVLITLNVWLLRRNTSMLRSFLWVLIFSLAYLLLLPLGGYRAYRPFVVRYDTFIPVALCIGYVYGRSTLYLLMNMVPRFRGWYASVVLMVVVIFTAADNYNVDTSRCERDAMEVIAASPEPIVRMEIPCYLLEWRAINDPLGSQNGGELLYIWRITSEKKLYTTSK